MYISRIRACFGLAGTKSVHAGVFVSIGSQPSLTGNLSGSKYDTARGLQKNYMQITNRTIFEVVVIVVILVTEDQRNVLSNISCKNSS